MKKKELKHLDIKHIYSVFLQSILLQLNNMNKTLQNTLQEELLPMVLKKIPHKKQLN